ncbi:MAG TPA: hypothetical protein VES73_03660 [Lamprocystis sp. (in: g-proteobacteria)]|nr:hypothetical protein [Lamprocystis sp. (in: g-proteobacteria)]
MPACRPSEDADPMRICDATDVDALAGEILRYLHGHQQAADTPEGIARWWIKRQRLEDSLLCVQSALDLLVSRAQVMGRQSPAGTTLYCLQPALNPAGGPPSDPDRRADSGPGTGNHKDAGSGI